MLIELEELKLVLGKVEELRMLLHKVISESEVLHDDNVVAISKRLDSFLNEYHNLIRKNKIKDME